MGPAADSNPDLPDARIGPKAVDLGLITAHQLREVLAQLSQVPVPTTKEPPRLSEALVRMGLLSQRQVDALVDDTAARLKRLGKYRIVRELGRGAMGVVYQAVDSDLGRTVALKMLLRAPQADPQEAALEEERFIREARVSANLAKHPNIVGVYEAGLLEGRHFIAMEFIEGDQFQNWRRKTNPTLRHQLSVLRDVAVAVDHAHRNGIIHRDLKPANVLIDERGQSHVTDFGLAKQAKQDVSLTLTGAGRAAGTPTYMSPEQAGGRRDVDRRTDVWSLGVMLYEILTGRPPFRGETPVDVMLKIVRDPVQPPSTAIREGAPVSFDKSLEKICLKALAKEAKDRYPSARAFGEDLSRWLKGQTVVIAPAPVAAKRNPALVGMAVVLVVVVGAVAAFYLSPGPPTKEEVIAEKAERAVGFVTQGQRLLGEGKHADALVAFARAYELDPSNRAALAGKQEAEQKIASRGMKAPAASAPSPSPSSAPTSQPAPVATAIPEAVRKAREYAQSNPKDVPGLLRAWQAARVPALGTPFVDEVNREYGASLEKHQELLRVELAELDQRVAGLRSEESLGAAEDVLNLAAKRHDTPDWESAIRSREEDLRKAVGEIFQPLREQALEARRKDDGATVSSIRNRIARWKWAGLETDLDEALARVAPAAPAPAPAAVAPVTASAPLLEISAELPALQGHQNGLSSAAYAPDGKAVVTASFDRTVLLWDVASRTVKAKLIEDNECANVACSADGKWIAGGFVDGSIRIWDTAKLQCRTLAGHTGQARVAFSPDSKFVASASADCTVRICDVASGALKLKLEGHPRGAMCLSFAPDGKTLAVGCADPTIKLWELPTGHERRTLSGGVEGRLWSVAFSPNGRSLVSGTEDGKVGCWDVESGRLRVLGSHAKEVRSVCFLLDGQCVASGSPDESLRVWNVSSGESVMTVKESAAFFGLAVSLKGDLLAGCMGSRILKSWHISAVTAPKRGTK